MIERPESTNFGRTPTPWDRRSFRRVVLLLSATMTPTWAITASTLAQAPTSPSAKAKTNGPKGSKAPIKPVVPAPSADEARLPMGEPGGIAVPGPRELDPAPPRRDDQVVPASIADPSSEPADSGGNPLPKAIESPGGSGPGAGSGGGDLADSFVLRPDRLPTGKQQVKLSVEVKAAAVINLGKESPVRIVVNNDGSTDAHDVRVVYQLPENLQFVSSEAPPKNYPGNAQMYVWNKPTLAAGGEWSIGLKVVAKDSKACEHVAGVSANAGSKASTMVQEPKLRVEALASPTRLLKGGQVKFEITVFNPGSGPAKNVNVQAKLSDGLKLGDDEVVEQVIDVIKPGERVQLDPLVVDTVAGGQQSCAVEARSPDVNFVADDHRITRTVEVTKPALTIDLAGQDFRYTGQSSEYKLTVTNTGTASAKAVTVSATLPQQGGKLARGPLPAGSNLTKDRKLIWKIGQLDPGQSFESKFVYDTSTPGLYKCAVEAVSGELRASKQMVTDVSGIADLDLKVSQTDRVIDVGKTTYYDFVIKNVGTKEATKIQLRGTLVNLKVNKPFYEESNGKFAVNPESGNQPTRFLFPEIPRLAAGQSVTLSLEVEATRAGLASGSVNLAHDDMGSDENSTIKGAITTKVTDNSGRSPRASSTPP